MPKYTSHTPKKNRACINKTAIISSNGLKDAGHEAVDGL
jgi:hypothetical protein